MALVWLHWPANLDSFCTNPEILGEKRTKSGRVGGWGAGRQAGGYNSGSGCLALRVCQALCHWLLVLCAEVGGAWHYLGVGLVSAL